MILGNWKSDFRGEAEAARRGVSLKVEGQRERENGGRNAVWEQRLDCWRESLAGEKAAEMWGQQQHPTPPPKESDLHKKLDLCEVPPQPMGG